MKTKCIALLISAVLFGAYADRTSAQITKSDRELFKWFDGLEFAKFADLPLIKVETGPGSHYFDEEPDNFIEFGFLIEETEKGFTYWDLALEKNVLVKKTKDVANNYRIDFKRYKISVAARELIKNLESESEQDWRGRIFDRMGETISQTCEVFFLARACFQQNKEDEAAELLTLAKTLSDHSRDVRLGEVSLKELLAMDLAHSLFWRIHLKFDDPKITRKELADDLEKMKKHFPNSLHFEQAVSMHSLILKMIAEDKKHPLNLDWKKLSTKQQVSELIYQLRNQDGKQLTQPGSCDIFCYDTGFLQGKKKKSASPAKRLVDIGIAAVPQLIEALADNRFTRSVGYHRDFYFSHQVLSVGDCAKRILSRISADAVWSTRYAENPNGEETSYADRAKQWYADIIKKGEKNLLIELTVIGDSASPQQARQLVEKYPEIALTHIKTAIVAAQSDWIREQLLDIVANYGEAVVPYIEDQLSKAKVLRLKIVLADHLYEWKPELSANTLIREFDNTIKQSDKIAELANTFHPRDNPVEKYYDDIETLIESMLVGNKTAVSRYLVKNFDNWPIGIRMYILENIGAYNLRRWGPKNIPEDRDPSDMPFSNELKADFEELFIKVIASPNQFFESTGADSFDSYRVCDYALENLAKCVPDEYHFSIHGSIFENEKQRIVALNHFRKKRKMPLLPVPLRQAANSQLTSRATRSIEKIIVETDATKRKTQIKQYQLDFGEAGLPTVFERLKSMPKTHPAFSDLNALANTLASTVVEVTNAEENGKESRYGEIIRSFKGKPLSADMIVNAFKAYLSNPDEHSTGIYLSILKGERGQGLRVEYALTKTWSPKNGIDAFYDLNYTIRIEGKSIKSSGTHRNVSSVKGSDMFDEYLEFAKKALESKPEGTFAVNFLMKRSK